MLQDCALSRTKDLHEIDSMPARHNLSQKQQQGEQLTFDELKYKIGNKEASREKIHLCAQQIQGDSMRYFKCINAKRSMRGA